jgi:hypothetical protein
MGLPCGHLDARREGIALRSTQSREHENPLMFHVPRCGMAAGGIPTRPYRVLRVCRRTNEGLVVDYHRNGKLRTSARTARM